MQFCSFRSDAWLQKTRNLSDVTNLRSVLEEAVAETDKNPRYKEMFGVRCQPGERLGRTPKLHSYIITFVYFSNSDLGFDSYQHCIQFKPRPTKIHVLH